MNPRFLWPNITKVCPSFCHSQLSVKLSITKNSAHPCVCVANLAHYCVIICAAPPGPWGGGGSRPPSTPLVSPPQKYHRQFRDCFVIQIGCILRLKLSYDFLWLKYFIIALYLECQKPLEKIRLGRRNTFKISLTFLVRHLQNTESLGSTELLLRSVLCVSSGSFVWVSVTGWLSDWVTEWLSDWVTE